MTSPRNIHHSLTKIEAEQYRSKLRKNQAKRDQDRLTKVRRHNRRNRWAERVRGAALFVGIVVFFTWVYWLAGH